MSIDKWGKDFEQKPIRTTFGAGVWAIIIVGGLSLIGGGVFMAVNVVSQPGRVVQKTLDADNVLFNYEWFRTQYADIQAMQPKIDNAIAARTAFEQSAGERSTWKTSDRNEWDRLNGLVLGLQNQRVTMIAAYNGNASKANKALFINPPLGGVVLPTSIE